MLIKIQQKGGCAMDKSVIELTAEITSAMHDEIYKAYYTASKFGYEESFGKFVAEQYKAIYNGINNTISEGYSQNLE